MARETQMTKKHFEAIARELRGLAAEHRIPAAMAVANALKETSPKFDWDRFVTACGVHVKFV
jgi:hypothetical protein